MSRFCWSANVSDQENSRQRLFNSLSPVSVRHHTDPDELSVGAFYSQEGQVPADLCREAGFEQLAKWLDDVANGTINPATVST